MTKIFLLATIMLAGFATETLAKGGGGANVYLNFVKPYQDSQRAKEAARRSNDESAISKARAVQRARAQAAAAARARLLASQRTTAASERSAPKPTDTAATATPKSDLENTTVLTKTATPVPSEAPATCRKYSPAVGGLVEGA